jgi:hypothetical protein
MRPGADSGGSGALTGSRRTSGARAQVYCFFTRKRIL